MQVAPAACCTSSHMTVGLGMHALGNFMAMETVATLVARLGMLTGHYELHYV